MDDNYTIPYSIDAEHSVLYAMFNYPAFVPEILAILDAEDFFRTQHQIYFASCKRLYARGVDIDVVSVLEDLADIKEKTLEDAQSYLVDVVWNAVCSESNVMFYAGVILKRSRLRKLHLVCCQIKDKITSGDTTDEDQLIDDALGMVTSACEDKSVAALTTITDESAQFLERLENKDDVEVVKTGFKSIDEKVMITGGQLIVVSGRPGMGKSTFAANIAENLMMRGEPVINFSLEMSRKKVVDRTYASIAGVPLTRIQRNLLNDNDWRCITTAVGQLKNKPYIIDDDDTQTLASIQSKVRKVYHKFGKVGMVVVDYLQLMRGDTNSRNDRREQIENISRGLKSLSKQFDCPVVALSQVNREVEKRPDKRPRNSDLREAGGIEQDADIILHLYRDVVYEKRTRAPKTVEVIIGKQRDGALGTCFLKEELSKSRMVEFEDGDEYQPDDEETEIGGLN